MQQQLENLIQQTVEGLQYQLWGYEYRPQSNSALLRIFIDTKAGITLDDCTVVSRQLSAVLDVEDLIPVAYILEVSSPGIDRVLFKPEQYKQYIGEQLKVRTHHLVENRRNFKGKLLNTTETDFVVKIGKEKYQIPFDTVDRARVKITINPRKHSTAL